MFVTYLLYFCRWAFDSSNPTAHAVWQAFHDHQQTAYGDVRNSDEWEPIVVQGNSDKLASLKTGNQ